jgi:hypothetical protein
MSRYNSWTGPWHTLRITEVWHYHCDNECPGHAEKQPDTYPDIEWELNHGEDCPKNNSECCCKDEQADVAWLFGTPQEQVCTPCDTENHDDCPARWPRCDTEVEVAENWEVNGIPLEVGVYRVRIANAGRDYWGEYDHDFEIEKVEDDE